MLVWVSSRHYRDLVIGSCFLDTSIKHELSFKRLNLNSLTMHLCQPLVNHYFVDCVWFKMTHFSRCFIATLHIYHRKPGRKCSIRLLKIFSPIFIVPSVIKVNYFSITEFSRELGSISLTKCYMIMLFLFHCRQM